MPCQSCCDSGCHFQIPCQSCYECGCQFWTLWMFCYGLRCHTWGYCLHCLCSVEMVTFSVCPILATNSACTTLAICLPYPPWPPAKPAPPWPLALSAVPWPPALPATPWIPVPCQSCFHSMVLALHPSPCSASNPSPSWTVVSCGASGIRSLSGQLCHDPSLVVLCVKDFYFEVCFSSACIEIHTFSCFYLMCYLPFICNCFWNFLAISEWNLFFKVSPPTQCTQVWIWEWPSVSLKSLFFNLGHDAELRSTRTCDISHHLFFSLDPRNPWSP